MTSWTAGDGAGIVTDERAVTAPMWRAVVLFRVVALLVAVVNLVRLFEGYRRPGLALAVVVAMAAWTAASTWWFLGGDERLRRRVAGLEIVVVPLATLATLLVEDPARLAAGGPVVTTVWSTAPVLSLAVARGWRGGLAAGLVTVGVLAVVRRAADTSFFYDAQLLLVAGLALGLAADWMRTAARRTRAAVAAQAATAERERLARDIHDEVLQVLAFVRRRGDEVARTEPDGPAAEIARLAGEQEVALRRLVAGGPDPVHADPDGSGDATSDLSAALAAVLPTRASLAVPAQPVRLPAAVTASLVAVVREAAANAERHAGPGTGLWVLVEDGTGTDGLGEVTVSVRDDGPGIPAGRLAAAEADGRLGVASSIRGRVAELGGTIDLHTGAGEGTEWEMRVPVR